jgi:thiamine-phosphate diphosphorylase
MDPVHERNNAISILQAATIQLVQSLNAQIIPSEGISFGFAIRGARDTGGVAAINGGIKTGVKKLMTTCPCTFGTWEPVVRIILTAMKFDPAMRSAAILQYSDRVLAVLENNLFLECSYPDTATGKNGISTMDWAIASCCEDGVPDVIIRKGTSEGASRIIMFGEEPADVANNIIICSNRV